jgi:hypothetical protein
MDIILNNLDLLKVFTIGLIKLDLSKTSAPKDQLVLKMMYHMYNVYQSSKCVMTNLLFPQSKQTCDMILLELEEEKDEEIIEFLLKLRSKIQNEPFDREVDAIDVAKKTFLEINQFCKEQMKKEDEIGGDLSFEDFIQCCFFEKEMILYHLINCNQREIYFQKKKLKPGSRKNIEMIYESLEKKCSRALYDKISKKKKLEPVLWQIRKRQGDDIIFACGDQRKKMDFILTLLQKIYL